MEEQEKSAVVARVYEKAPRTEEPAQLHGRIAIKMELLRGRPLAGLLAEGGVRETGMSLGLMHRDLHVRPSEGLPRAYGLYEPALLEFPGLSARLRDKLTAFLRSRRDDRLCHGDFHPGNILQTRNGWRLIDWPTAFAGDPLADVALTLRLLRAGGRAGGKPALLEPFRRRRLVHGYLDGYFGREEPPGEVLARWDLLNLILARRSGSGYRLPGVPLFTTSLFSRRLQRLFSDF